MDVEKLDMRTLNEQGADRWIERSQGKRTNQQCYIAQKTSKPSRMNHSARSSGRDSSSSMKDHLRWFLFRRASDRFPLQEIVENFESSGNARFRSFLSFDLLYRWLECSLTPVHLRLFTWSTMSWSNPKWCSSSWRPSHWNECDDWYRRSTFELASGKTYFVRGNVVLDSVISSLRSSLRGDALVWTTRVSIIINDTCLKDTLWIGRRHESIWS